MKLAIVIGTRPEIIKMAPIVRAYVARKVPFVLLHTGQHYSRELDGVFFEELNLPAPEHNLSVGSVRRRTRSGRSWPASKACWQKRSPTSCSFRAIRIPYWLLPWAREPAASVSLMLRQACAPTTGTMPEEINRILVDHIADVLFAPTANAGSILASEGIEPSRIHVTGNTVVDELLL